MSAPHRGVLAARRHQRVNADLGRVLGDNLPHDREQRGFPVVSLRAEKTNAAFSLTSAVMAYPKARCRKPTRFTTRSESSPASGLYRPWPNAKRPKTEGILHSDHRACDTFL